jgi:hypothetical protein
MDLFVDCAEGVALQAGDAADVLLTLWLAVYAVAVRDTVYETSSSFILINPPAPPTPENIARDPSLGRINWTTRIRALAISR